MTTCLLGCGFEMTVPAFGR